MERRHTMTSARATTTTASTADTKAKTVAYNDVDMVTDRRHSSASEENSGASTTDFQDEDAPTSRSATPAPGRLNVELDVDREQRDEYQGVKSIVRNTVRGWANVENAALEVSPVRGGITNALFKVRLAQDAAPTTTKDPIARAVVVRVFGKGTDQFITHRKVQGETSHVLNEHGFGAKVLGVFSNGLVEEFIEAESVAPEELANGGILLRRVAAQMRRLHKEVAPDLVPRAAAGETIARARANAIWDTLQVWFDLAYGVANDPTIFKNDARKKSILASLKIDSDSRQMLFEVIRARCEAVNSQTVYCHNDIHAGNFLLNRKTDNLTLIDYEYADYGPRAFDMANLFCEFAGFECNYDQFPTCELRREFYSAYLHTTVDAEIDALEAEVAAWTPVTHAFWALWAVIQAKYSAIDFDFLGFAAMRMKVFYASALAPSEWVPTNTALGGQHGTPEKSVGWNATAEGNVVL